MSKKTFLEILETFENQENAQKEPKVILDVNPENSRRKDFAQQRMYDESYDSFINMGW
jgi:3-deoxy-D-arabino-heptulosonate 7-phosphate (DAHP) synthase